MRRREFITLLGGATAPPLLWPLPARAAAQSAATVGALLGTEATAPTVLLTGADPVGADFAIVANNV